MKHNVILFRDSGDGSDEVNHRRASHDETDSSTTAFHSDVSTPRADPYERLFAEAGFVATSIPVLGYVFVNLDQLADELRMLNQFQGIILTSPRAVQAVVDAFRATVDATCSDRCLTSVAFTSVPIFVVGAATQKMANERFTFMLRSTEETRHSFDATTPSPSSSASGVHHSSHLDELTFLGSQTNNAKNLAEFIVEYFQRDLQEGKNVRLLYPASSIRSPTFQERLESAGIRVVGLSVYETMPRSDVTDHLEKWARRLRDETERETEDRLTALVFFSPSGVKAVASALDTLNWPVDDFLHVAVGPTTLKALNAKGYRRTTMSDKPKAEEVVDAVVAQMSEAI